MLHFQKILVIKLRALGDVIMSLPVVDNLHAAFPNAQIDFLTEKPCLPVVENRRGLNRILSIDRGTLGKLSMLKQLHWQKTFISGLRKERYDLAIDLFGNPRSALLTRLSNASIRLGYNFRVRRFAYNKIVEPRGDRVHEVEFNLDALRAIGIPIVTSKLNIDVDQESRNKIDMFWRDQNLSSYPYVIGLNASGGWYTKRWPLASFAELGKHLQHQLGAKIILLWGPGELDDARKIAEMMQGESTVAPATDLKTLAALLARLNLLVSNDSGPMHLATAVATPVVGIYGPTQPKLQGPWGEKHRVVYKNDLECLGCNGVTCKINTHDCMQNLSVDDVLRVTLSQLV